MKTLEAEAENASASNVTWQQENPQDFRQNTELVAKSPKPHRIHKGHAGTYEIDRDGHMTSGGSKSYLAPPLIPLDITNQSGLAVKESVGSGKKRPAHPSGAGSGVKESGSKLENGRGSAVLSDSDSAVSESGDSAVSMDQLSTTCLGAEVTVKPRPKLEASRTYHVFPTETLVKEAALPGAPALRLWSPGKSSAAVLSRLGGEGGAANRSLARDCGGAGQAQLFDPGLGSPFRSSPRLTRPRTEESRTRPTVEFITKEFVGGVRHTVNLCPDWHRGSTIAVGGGGSISNSGGASAGLKANTIQPDLPPTFQLKGVSTQPHLAAGGGAGAVTRRKRGLCKTAVGRGKKDSRAGLQLECTDRNSWSASTTDTTTSSGKGNVQNTYTRKKNQIGLDIAAAGSSSRQQGRATPPSLGPVPYFKFWNSSIPPKSRESRRNAGRRERGLRVGVGLDGGELNLAQLAQLVLADEVGRQDQGLADAAQKVLEEQQRLEQLQTTKQESSQRGGQGSIATGVGLTHSQNVVNLSVLVMHEIALTCQECKDSISLHRAY
ncbi:hypothetical protein PoB_007210000 [Plakobranchus ocellatus]|uniref:Uncharacterized protein n=1 Tax=Plakobranchus ocellatus TaxID=259542 RepID=A0AAV4DN84_9GAST|nr:hypothetical protein PoB_007210000 [Plakobranchus ocellatus]